MTHRGCTLTEAISAQSSGTTGPCPAEQKTREVQMAQAGMAGGSGEPPRWFSAPTAQG